MFENAKSQGHCDQGYEAFLSNAIKYFDIAQTENIYFRLKFGLSIEIPFTFWRVILGTIKFGGVVFEGYKVSLVFLRGDEK